MFETYPRHVHKPNGVFTVVHSDVERDAKIADGWYLTALEAEQAEGTVERNPAEGAADAEDAPAPSADAGAQAPDGPDKMNAPQAIEFIEATDNVAQLEAWKLAELAGKARKGVLAALDVRLAALSEA
jgi:hypothetical protein